MDGEVLSQQEIDALLGQLAGKERAAPPEPEPVIRPYDFRQAKRLTREKVRALERILGESHRQLSTLLALATRSPVSVEAGEIQELTFGEYIQSLPAPSLIGVLDGRGGRLPLLAVVQFNPELAYALFERFMGAPGHGGRRQGLPRAPTDLEMAIFERHLFRRTAEAFEAAWQRLDPRQTFAVRQVESNPLYVRVQGYTDSVVVATALVTVGSGQDLFSVCLPLNQLEPSFERFASELLDRPRPSRTPQEAAVMSRAVAGARIPVDVILGGAWLTLEELAGLREGDIVLLDQGPDDPVGVWLGGHPKLVGRAGTVGNRLAVQILDVAAAGALQGSGGEELR